MQKNIKEKWKKIPALQSGKQNPLEVLNICEF